MECSKLAYYEQACGGQPDPENMFDPSSLCTTLTNRMQFASLADSLPGVGNCKVTNFGFTNGWLPTGFMSSAMVDWHSQLSTYEDSNFIMQPISSSGESIAQTRCAQIGNSVAIMGFAISSPKWCQFTTHSETVYDPDSASYIDIVFPGNKILCELEKKCNSDRPDTITHDKNQCLEMPEVILFCQTLVLTKSLLRIHSLEFCIILN